MIHKMAQQYAQQLAKNAPQFEDKVNIWLLLFLLLLLKGSHPGVPIVLLFIDVFLDVF